MFLNLKLKCQTFGDVFKMLCFYVTTKMNKSMALYSVPKFAILERYFWKPWR